MGGGGGGGGQPFLLRGPCICNENAAFSIVTFVSHDCESDLSVRSNFYAFVDGTVVSIVLKSYKN